MDWTDYYSLFTWSFRMYKVLGILILFGVAAYCGYSFSENKWKARVAEMESRFAAKRLDIARATQYAIIRRNEEKGKSNEKKDINCVEYLSQPIPSDCLLLGGKWLSETRR